MSRKKPVQTAVPGIGFIYQPKYRNAKGELKASAIWWMEYNTNDGAIRRSTKQRDQSAAHAELVRVAGQRVSGLIQDSAPERVTFGRLFDDLITDYRERNLSSLQQLEDRIRKHLRPYFGEHRVIDLRKGDIEAFKRASLKKELAPATVNRMLSAIRRALQIGADQDPPLVTRAIPHWFSKLEEDNVRTGLVSSDVYHAVLPHMAPHVRTAFIIGYHLGMRLGEILSLRWDQVDLPAGVIRLQRKQTKGKKDRTAPIYGDLPAGLEMAHSARGECPYVVQLDGRRVYSLKTAWAAAFERSGLMVDTGRRRKDGRPLLKPAALFHDLRRTAATNMDEAGVSRERIKDCVGWKTDAMFARYRIGSTKAAVQTGQQMDAWMARRAVVTGKLERPS